MRRLIDLGAIWRDGCRAAGRFLQDHDARDPSGDASPVTLDGLLAEEIDVDAGVRRIAAR